MSPLSPRSPLSPLWEWDCCPPVRPSNSWLLMRDSCRLLAVLFAWLWLWLLVEARPAPAMFSGVLWDWQGGVIGRGVDPPSKSDPSLMNDPCGAWGTTNWRWDDCRLTVSAEGRELLDMLGAVGTGEGEVGCPWAAQ